MSKFEQLTQAAEAAEAYLEAMRKAEADAAARTRNAATLANEAYRALRAYEQEFGGANQ